MVGGGVQRVETMILVLDFRAVGDGEADFAEAADNVLGHLGERMEFAEGAAAAGQGEIGGFLGQGGLEFEFGAAFGKRGFEFGLGGVDEFAGGGFFLLGERAELFHQRGELAVRRQSRRLWSVRARRGRARLSNPPARFVSAVQYRSSMDMIQISVKGCKRHKENSESISRFSMFLEP